MMEVIHLWRIFDNREKTLYLVERSMAKEWKKEKIGAPLVGKLFLFFNLINLLFYELFALLVVVQLYGFS